MEELTGGPMHRLISHISPCILIIATACGGADELPSVAEIAQTENDPAAFAPDTREIKHRDPGFDTIPDRAEIYRNANPDTRKVKQTDPGFDTMPDRVPLYRSIKRDPIERAGLASAGRTRVNLTGVWGLHVAYSHYDNDDLSRVDEVETHLIARVEISQLGDNAILDTTVCDYETGAHGEPVEYPESAIDATPPIVAMGRLITPAVGGQFEVDPATLITGWSSQDPANERMPGDGLDPRISDDDRDGVPGVRVKTGSGNASVAGRTTFALAGDILSEDLIAGEALARDDLVILSSESGLAPEGLVDRGSLATGGQFTAVRVDPTTDCAGLINRSSILFGR